MISLPIHCKLELDIYVFARPSHGSRQDLSPSEELPEKIIINDVPTPPFPLKTSSKSGPTPPDKRILDQKEFDKKLKAKRLFFAKGRSMSLASFKISSRLRKSSASPKKAKYLLHVVQELKDLFISKSCLKDLEIISLFFP